MNPKSLLYGILAVITVIIIIMAGMNFPGGILPKRPEPEEPEIPPVYVTFDDPYVFNKEGYEPSIAVDSTGALYYTAHKNLDDKSSWDYLASWFFISTNNLY